MDNSHKTIEQPSAAILSSTVERETLPVLYRDDELIVVNKPSALLVHRSMIDRHETRFAMQIVRDQIGQYVYPVHRLDKPTSGTLLFALTAEAARTLNQQFSAHKVEKKYLAVVRGYSPESIFVDHPLKEKLDKMTDKKAQQDKEAQEAQTHIYALANTELPVEIEGHATSRYSLIKAIPKQGRKHQIRRHCKHINHPIIGDAKHGRGRHNRYFKEQLQCPRLLLHAYELSFCHPSSGKTISCRASLDNSWLRLLERFNWLDNIDQDLCLQAANES